MNCNIVTQISICPVYIKAITIGIMKSKNTGSGRKSTSFRDNTPGSHELDAIAAMISAGNYFEAESLAKQLTLRYPLHISGWTILGAVLMQTRRGADALIPLSKLVELSPDNFDAHNNLGMALRESGNPGAAVASFRHALRIKPDYAEAYNNLGLTLCGLGHTTEAEEYFRRALAFRPDYAEIHNNLGITLMATGKLNEAEACFRCALLTKPDYAEAQNNLGITLHNLGHLSQALDCFNRAIAINPGYAEAFNHLGNTLLLDGRTFEAAASYLKALQFKPDYAEAHYDLGIALLVLGRPGEAEASYRQAIQIRPDYAEAHNNLGVMLYDLGRLDEAMASYQRAIESKPDYAEAFNNLGNALLDLSRFNEAELAYRQAIKINPLLPETHSNLGSALMALGKMSEAERSLGKAIELAPGQAKPLSTALLYIPYRLDDPRFSQLEAVYAQRESLTADERIKLNFAMGKAMENIGQYDRAFGAYEEGNRLHFQLHPFDETEDERNLENTCSLFTPELFRECAALESSLPPDNDERVPIFIVGMLRSGTTLIEQILASHPSVFGAGELPTLKEVLGQRNPGQSANAQQALTAMRKLGQKYLDRVWKLSPDTRYITDKLPGNYSHLGLIRLMLPNAKIIHAIRDPVDTCFSCYALRFTHGHDYSYELGALARQFLRYKKLMQHWHAVLPPGLILDVRYEDNIAHPEREARRMLDYLRLPWDPACLNFHEKQRAIHTASVTQVRTPLYTSSVARWKHFEKHLEPLLELLHPDVFTSEN